ncbi:hypothetical protein [Mycolicibacterium sp. 624]|uniref:hypothetical protein n=1 Tax=Mycolicibacterium sp. 624 TaxID=3156314 RepID=UPI003396E49C
MTTFVIEAPMAIDLARRGAIIPSEHSLAAAAARAFVETVSPAEVLKPAGAR